MLARQFKGGVHHGYGNIAQLGLIGLVGKFIETATSHRNDLSIAIAVGGSN